MIGFNLIENASLRSELQGLYELRYVYSAKITQAGYNYDYVEFGNMYQKEMSDYSLLREAILTPNFRTTSLVGYLSANQA